MKVLIATDKPFAKIAVDGIRNIIEGAGYELVLLEGYTEKAQLIEAVSDVDAMIIRSDKATAEVIEAAKNLKVIVRAGAGYDNIDLEACTARGIVAMNTPGQNSNAVAELVLAMMIYSARNMFNGTSGKEIHGKKIGVHAYGNVGRIVARYAKGFGMEVYAFDPFVADKSIFANDGVTEVTSVEELYSTCDYVSLHIPATPKTVKSINFELLSKMPKGATLINTARKEVICEEGMVKMMAERADFKYITDIMPSVHAELLEKYPTRYFASPKKMGAQTSEANVNAGLASGNQIVALFKDGDKRYQVNK